MDMYDIDQLTHEIIELVDALKLIKRYSNDEIAFNNLKEDMLINYKMSKKNELNTLILDLFDDKKGEL
jgi:hypothetical protein